MNKVDLDIQEMVKKVNPHYFPKYHYHVPCGWLNDPNGFIFFRGKYHLFYQYSPYTVYNSKVHWGHIASKDLIHWEEYPVALCPTEEYESEGCWSGSSIEKDGVLYLYYTGFNPKNSVCSQTICVATSEDGINFKKSELNPIIKLELESTLGSPLDFRDPYIVKRENDYMLLIGTRYERKPRILAYKSTDLLHFEFESIFFEDKRYGIMFECPTFLDNKYLITSPVSVDVKGNDFWNCNSCLFLAGHVENKVFVPELCTEIDHGLDFYAPQGTNHDGVNYMVTWLGIWGRKGVTGSLGHGWEGLFTLPRVIEAKDNRLIQKPVPEIEKYFVDGREVTISNKPVTANCASNIRLSYKESFKIFLGNKDNYFTISYDKDKDELTSDRRTSSIQLYGCDNSNSTKGFRVCDCHTKNGELYLEIFVDRNCMEIYINNGVEVMSNLMYFNDEIIEVWSDKELKATVNTIKI